MLRPDAVAANHVLKKIAILRHCRPHDSVDWDHTSPPKGSPATLDSEQVANGVGNMETVTASLVSGAAAREDTESEFHHGKDFEEEAGPQTC